MLRNRFLIPALALFLVSCSSPGSQYLGEWENPKNTNDSFTVVREGEGFTVVTIKRSIWNGEKIGEDRLSAVLVNGLLQVQAGFASATLTYDESSDTITSQSGMGILQYARKSLDEESPH